MSPIFFLDGFSSNFIQFLDIYSHTLWFFSKISSSNLHKLTFKIFILWIFLTVLYIWWFLPLNFVTIKNLSPFFRFWWKLLIYVEIICLCSFWQQDLMVSACLVLENCSLFSIRASWNHIIFVFLEFRINLIKRE